MQNVFDTRDLELQPGYYSARRRQSSGSAARRLMLVAGGLGCAVVCAGGLWQYTDHRTHTVPVIEADTRPMRVKPENPGGMQIAGVGESILTGPEQIPQSLAPPPEMPDPGSLHLQEQSSRAHAADNIPPGLTAQDTAPAATPTTPPAQLAAPILRTAPATPAGKQVQLASLGSEAAANAEWARLSRLMPDLLARRRPELSQVDRDGKTFWRLRTSGFTDATAVSNFCNQVRAKGAPCTAAGL